MIHQESTLLLVRPGPYLGSKDRVQQLQSAAERRIRLQHASNTHRAVGVVLVWFWKPKPRFVPKIQPRSPPVVR